MACKRYKNAAIRSVQTVYNNAVQAVTATEPTQMVVLGSQVCDTGCSIETTAAGFHILSNGIYRLSFDVTVNSTAAGINLATVQMMMDGDPLPCAVSTEGIAQNAPTTLHAETILPISVCRIFDPTITIEVSGVDGSVNHICATAVKIA